PPERPQEARSTSNSSPKLRGARRIRKPTSNSEPMPRPRLKPAARQTATTANVRLQIVSPRIRGALTASPHQRPKLAATGTSSSGRLAQPRPASNVRQRLVLPRTPAAAYQRLPPKNQP